MALSTFITEVKNRGVAKQSHYIVQLGMPPFITGSSAVESATLVPLYCDQAMFPEMALATATIKDYGVNREVVYDKLYGQVTLSFFCDQGMVIKHFFDTWVRHCVASEGGIFRYQQEYTAANMWISQIDEQKSVVYTTVLRNVYPKLVNDVQLAAAGRDVTRFQVVFTYEYSDITLHPQVIEQAMAAGGDIDLVKYGILQGPMQSFGTGSPTPSMLPSLGGGSATSVLNRMSPIVQQANSLTSRVSDAVSSATGEVNKAVASVDSAVGGVKGFIGGVQSKIGELTSGVSSGLDFAKGIATDMKNLRFSVLNEGAKILSSIKNNEYVKTGTDILNTGRGIVRDVNEAKAVINTLKTIKKPKDLLKWF
jgi:hypothetical protein